MGKKKYLLLLTDFYPFDNREPYVKNEIKFLAAHFQSIFIFCSYQKQQQSIYELPLNTSSHFLNTSLSPLEKAKCLKWLFSKIFWNEIKFAKRSYQLSTSFSILKIILLQLQIAEKCEAQLI
ncbi:MAG: hypothetical protein LH473_13290, partial [Chitinophagales bacterium]|nr:hypothetical protein [Chitinophagales bacterium]